MSRIKLLDDSLINKISAGEVIERPASVLKELLENALDAGADRLDIELVEGGTKRIAVTDNGCGMTADEIPLAVTRHATSKIASADDLFQMATLGFRGEALASMTAVAKVMIASRPRGSDAGTQFEFFEKTAEHGESRPWTGPEGTLVRVEDLFAAVPAREKFLRKPQTEYAHCMEVIQAMALGHPEVAFRVLHGDKKVLDLVAEPEPFTAGNRLNDEALRHRAKALFPKKQCGEWVGVTAQSSYGEVYGIVSPPGQEEGTTKHMWTFANGRLVKDQTLRRGILRGYHSHLLKGRYPGCVLFFRCAPELLDVNVHPAKMELRFQYPSEVQQIMARAIRESLRMGAWAHDTEHLTTPAGPVDSNLPPQVNLPPRPVPYQTSPARSQPTAGGGENREIGGSHSSYRPPAVSTSPAPIRASSQTPLSTAAELFSTPKLSDMALGETQDINWHELEYLGSFARCYLIFASRKKLLLVDQHAFHERILYEQLIRDSNLLKQLQFLLVPESVTLAESEVTTLQEHRPQLQDLGIKLNDVSPTEVEVVTVPVVLENRDLTKLLAELAEKFAEGQPVTADEVSHTLLATIACHSAVRSGEELPHAELQILLRQAGAVDFYHNCPHGRRVLRWYTEAEVGRMFDR